MRYPASEKLEIINLVEQSHLPASRTLKTLGIPRTTFYRWYDRLETGGPEAKSPAPGHVWNRIPDDVRDRVVKLALDETALSPRELAVRFTDTEKYFVSEASVYRLLKSYDLITSPAFIVIKAADEFKDKTTAINQLWQTDFTYLKVIGWGWMYLSTILDDYSRYIITWKLCTSMKAEDVTNTLGLALKASGCDRARVRHKPRLLSDNGASYISGDLAEWLQDKGMSHVRGAPYHPQTQGKIERWHQTLKNRILLENYFFPGDLEASIEAFVDHYNHQRYHESINNLTPADVYFGRGQAILEQRKRIKRKTIEARRLRAAKATLLPWLPRVALMTPMTPGCRWRSRSMASSPPRTLMAPMGVWFSCLTQTSAPARSESNGQAISGVGGTWAWTTAAALSRSSRVIVSKIGAPKFQQIPSGSLRSATTHLRKH